MNKTERIQKQISKYNQQLNMPPKKKSLIIALAFIIIFQVFDSFGYGIYGNMQEIIMKDFAGLPFGANIAFGGAGYQPYQKTLSTFTLVNTIGYATLGIMPLYRSLADKLGRKPILIISTLFLGGAMFLSGITHSMYLFAMGSVMLIFFGLHDVLMLYLFEIVPDNKRATWCGIVRAVGTAAMIGISCIRFTAMNPDGTIRAIPWRNSYIVLSVMFVFIALVALLFLKESKQFMTKRRQLLYQTLEKTDVKSQGNEKSSKKTEEIKMSSAFSLLLKNHQLKWISISIMVLFAANNMILSYNNSILAQNGLNTFQITISLIVSNVVAILIFLLMGIISDRQGRKKSLVFFGIFTSIGFLMFTFISPLMGADIFGSVFAGVGLGITNASFGNMTEIILIMLNESTPTHMRGVVNGIRNFFMVSAVISALFGAFLFKIMPVSKACFVLTIPFIILCILIVTFKVRETANVSLEEIDSQF